jgi:hypothetical protein
LPVEPQNEAPIHRNARALNFADGFDMGVGAVRLPVRLRFDALQRRATRRFEPDQDLLAARLLQQRQQFVIIGS